MPTQRERFENYFKLPGTRYRKYEAALLTVADAFDDAERNGISPERLGVIVSAVSSSSSYVSESSCDLLARASERWPEAAEAILKMSRDSKARVRFWAICSLSRGTATPVINEVLKAGLNDRSAMVRWKAADRANQLDQRHLISDVAAALAIEKNENARGSIEFALGFLRDGCVIRRQPDGSYRISARLDNGGGGTVKDVSEAEFRAKGIEAILSEIRERRLIIARKMGRA